MARITKSEQVLGPPHYTNSDVEPIRAIEAWSEAGIDYHLGCVVKYIARYRSKDNPTVDLQKALWYLARALYKFMEPQKFASWWSGMDATVRAWIDARQ